MQENKQETVTASAIDENGVYHTPQAAIDAVMANPPFGGTGGGEPQSNPEHHLSNGEAIAILARIAAERTRTVEEVTALEMGANRMLKKYMQKQRNWARRRAKTVE